MSWNLWPFTPRSLTEMIGPYTDSVNNERFISLLVSGCSERMSRPLTVIEPVIDQNGQAVEEGDPANPNNKRPKLRRIDPINLREHFIDFCETLRNNKAQDLACQDFDIYIAHKIIEAVRKSPSVVVSIEKYHCRLWLVDMGSVIIHNNNIVAILLTGQLAPDSSEEKAMIRDTLGEIAGKEKWPQEFYNVLLDKAEHIKTAQQFISQHYIETRKNNPRLTDQLKLENASVNDLFLDAVHEINRIVLAEFQMHKRERENNFRDRLRERLPSLLTDHSTYTQLNRGSLSNHMSSVLEQVRTFCGTNYLALFVSPKQFISYEVNYNLLPLFALVGLDGKVAQGIQHFNWRRALREFGNKESQVKWNNFNNEQPRTLTTDRTLSPSMNIEIVMRSAVKGEQSKSFSNALLVCPLEFSEKYRAVLVWGPFSHLTKNALYEEVEFLRDISEMIMTRLLSLAQLADSEEQIKMWSNVAGLLAHHSRSAMNPVSTGVNIINDYLNGGDTYSNQDAIKACASLAVAAKVVAGAVRVPLLSFAAMAEQVYQFKYVNLENIVTDCIKLYQPFAATKGVMIKPSPGISDLPLIEIDETKMRDVVGYIVDNAVKYSHPDKEVRICANVIGTNIQLTIEDFGLGIKPEDDQLIYEHGHQGERSKKSEGEEGEGLGLYHASIIVKAHKGRIFHSSHSGPRTLNSANLEGYVVKFTIELPISQENGRPSS